MSIRAVSFGGGVQSTALLVLAVKGEIDFPLFIFSNVGDQSENPETLSYVRDYSIPYAEANGIEFVERQWVTRKGEVRDLYVDLLRQEPLSVVVESGDDQLSFEGMCDIGSCMT